jgi:N-acetyl-anhydromuramyl-L-alanine amidase AmpD
MSNSKLVDYVKISPNSSNPRTKKIDTITIHHMAGNLSVETCGDVFAPKSRQASSNYGIGSDGRVGMYVEEANRAWTSSSGANDNRAVTIEVANDEIGGNWHVSDKALAKLIDLCVDICKRNGIAKLNYTGDTSGNLTMHKWFAATNCPGPYLESKFPYIADEVNKRLNAAAEPAESATLYRVQVGAYKQKENAEKMLAKLKAAGFDAFITTYKAQAAASEPKPSKEIAAGALVRVKTGAKDYNGGTLAPFVYARIHTVKSINGDRVVITFDGVVIAAVRASDLTLV